MHPSPVRNAGFCNGPFGVKSLVPVIAAGLVLLSVVGASGRRMMRSEGAGEPI
jgi:hypothetical protein